MHCASNKVLSPRKLLLLLLMSLTSIAVAAPVTIELRPQVQVKTEQVILGDIAYLSTPDLALLRRLLVVPLGAAPHAGGGVTLERDTLARWIYKQAGVSPQQVVWKGVTQTHIAMANQEVSGESIVNVAQSALQDWLAPRSQRAQVQVLSTPADLLLPTGELSLRVRPLDQTQPRKHMLVWVDAYVGQRFIRTVAVNFEVSAYAQAAVATRPIQGGTLLDAQTIAWREVDLASQPAPLWVSQAAPEQRLRRSVQSGEVLTTRHIESIPEVTRGEWANLQMQSGAVILESRVEILQDGRLGQMVRVKQSQAHSSIVARVTGPGRVEVQQ